MPLLSDFSRADDDDFHCYHGATSDRDDWVFVESNAVAGSAGRRWCDLTFTPQLHGRSGTRTVCGGSNSQRTGGSPDEYRHEILRSVLVPPLSAAEGALRNRGAEAALY